VFTTISFLDKGLKHDKFLDALLFHKFIVFSPEMVQEAEVVVSFDINSVGRLLEFHDKLRVLFLFKLVKGKDLDFLRENNDKILVITTRSYSTIKNVRVNNRNIRLRALQSAHIIKAMVSANVKSI